MEQRDRVRLVTSSSFDLERDEVKRLYIYLSLFQYRSLRKPNYNERPLIETLEQDFRRFLVEIQQQALREPNNLTLSKIRAFFDIHYNKLKEFADEYRDKNNTD